MGEQLRLEVWDTGLGIPEEKQKIVFREFERLANAAKSAPGLGLGLSIVERLGKVLGHSIALRSQPGRGSVFGVELPIVEALPVAAETPETMASPHAPLAGLVVLAIDNEPRILEGMRSLLGGWGCQIFTAADEAEAKAALGSIGSAPDVVIADYHLDATDGLTLVTKLRESIDAEVPAILLTADRTPEVRDRASMLDIHILNKPLKPAVLRSLLSQWRMMRGAAE
jgi:CheY-like chemotaxis protein